MRPVSSRSEPVLPRSTWRVCRVRCRGRRLRLLLECSLRQVIPGDMVSVSSLFESDGRTYKGVTEAPACQNHAHGHAHIRGAEEVADDRWEHGYDTANGES